jgi:hypothetical protein
LAASTAHEVVFKAVASRLREAAGIESDAVGGLL